MALQCPSGGPRVTHYTNVAFLLPNVPNLLIAQWTLKWGVGGALVVRFALKLHCHSTSTHFYLVSGDLVG